MAATEDDVQAKRDRVAELQEAIADERVKRAAALQQQQLDATSEQLDGEIARLESVLDEEKRQTAIQAGEEPANVIVAAPETPVVPDEQASSDAATSDATPPAEPTVPVAPAAQAETTTKTKEK